MTAFWFAVVFLLQLQLPDQVQPGTVTGRLLTTKGTPAAGIRIAAVPVSEDKAAAMALLGISQTDADGQYRLENIPPGRYFIFAGLIDFPSYYPNATSLDRATVVAVDSGATVSGIDFSMARPLGLTVAGRLAIPSTMQFMDSWVASLFPQVRNTTGDVRQAKVEQDGSFEFAGVSPGEYRVGSNLAGAASRIVRLVDVDLLDLVLPVVDCDAGVLVSGRLVGNPTDVVRSMTLTGSPTGCTVKASVETGGGFTFNKVPEGTYQLQLTPSPLGWSPTSLTVETSNLVGLEVRLPTLVRIKGKAEIEDGSAFPRTSRGIPLPIRAVRTSGGEVSSSILDDGTFELLLAKGNYRVSVPGIPPGYYLKSMTSGSTDLANSALEVADETSREIHVTLGFIRRSQPGVRVTGHLSFARTGALLNAESVLLVSAGNRQALIRQSPVSADGLFEFSDVPPGTYNLETFPDNPAALYGIVVSKTDVTGIEFTLPVLMKVKGGIEWADQQGAALSSSQPNVSVQFTRKEGDRMMAWGTLVQAGSFHFYLPEGDYRFSVSGIPSEFNLASVTSGDENILESGLRIRSDFDPPSLRVMLRGK
jgi:hypothetical protein